MMEVPAGTSIGWPSMVTSTESAAWPFAVGAGVPKSAIAIVIA